MIEIRADQASVQITLPTTGMSNEEVNDFVTWLRVEAVARLSKLSSAAAWQLSEDLKAGWWERNKQRFGE